MLVTLGACEGGGGREWRASDHQQPSANDARSEPTEPSEPSSIAEAAAALYRARCGTCHGDDGRGAATAAMSVPDLTSGALQESRTDEDLALVIREGRGAMPGFGSELNERGIQVLVEHVRSLRAGE